MGSTRALSDVNGVLTDTYNYEAFGDTLNKTGITENSYLYTGEQYDANLDNYYLRARYYDQGVGRFTQQDTWMGNNQDPVTLHKYLYANVDPVNMIDPTGNFGIASFGAANNIRGILTDVQIETGFSLLDGIFSGDSAGESNALVGIAALGGVASLKLLKLLNKKIRKTCNSFDEDTEVWTDAGTQLITDILIGDKVWALNEETGEFELQDVTHLIQREGDYQLIEITVANETIDATENHPFYVKEKEGWKWKDAVELKVDDIVLDRNNNEQVIAKVNARPYVGKVFNLTVDNVHTYLVGESGVVAHNAGNCGVPDFKTWSHLFRGTRKNNGSISGLHHAEGGLLPRGVSIDRVVGRGKAGFYDAKVFSIHSGQRVRKKANGGVSTMFPDNWSRSKVRDVSNAANLKSLANGNNVVPLSDILGSKYNGINIKIFRNPAGNVVSIFPQF